MGRHFLRPADTVLFPGGSHPLPGVFWSLESLYFGLVSCTRDAHELGLVLVCLLAFGGCFACARSFATS